MANRHEHPINIDEIQQPFHGECCIYRVHERLRRANREAYEPLVVSIGPYHRQNPRLQEMERHKWWYLRSFLLRRNDMTSDMYVSNLRDLVERVRNCYAEPIVLNDDELIDMMLLDGCFIIEFFRNETHNPALEVHWIAYQIYFDMILLENQLPFFVLSRLYELTMGPNEVTFMERVKSAFEAKIPKPCLNSEYIGSEPGPGEIKHLLHLVHVLCFPKVRDGSPERFNIVNKIAHNKNIRDIIRGLMLFPVHLLFNSFPFLMSLVISTSDETTNENDPQNQMRSAVELQEAGVKFKKVGEFYTGNANLFDIKFENGLMEVPCFSVDDGTDTFFRNLIAFEQHFSNTYPKYFTNFAHFMEELIRSKKDVELLRQAGIIKNLLGDDQDVSNLFNNLGEGIMVVASQTDDPDPSLANYSNVRKELNSHCRRIRNQVLAKLMHGYFNSPWAGISTLGAIALLGLAFAQTVGTYK